MEAHRIAGWISASRIGPFLEAVDHDIDAALELYDWHARTSAACFLAMHHLEVLIRNAVDGELGKQHPDEPLTQTWLMDFDVLRPDAVKQVITAVERLRHAFPGAKERKDLSSRMDQVRRFRNRLAHHDSILNQPIAARYEQMLELAGFVDRLASEWLATTSDVQRLLSQRPGDPRRHDRGRGVRPARTRPFRACRSTTCGFRWRCAIERSRSWPSPTPPAGSTSMRSMAG